MDEWIEGKGQATDEDGESQLGFWAFLKAGELSRHYGTRIGAELVRENREVLN